MHPTAPQTPPTTLAADPTATSWPSAPYGVPAGYAVPPVAGAPFAGAPVAGAPIAGAPIAGAPIAGAPIAGAPITGNPAAGYQATAGAPAPQPAQQPGSQPAPARPVGAQLAQLAGPASVLLLALGLSIPFDSSNSWSTSIAWSVFALVASLVAQAGAFGGGAARTRWLLTAAGTAGVLAYWVLLVLPSVSSNAGLVLTIGAGAAAAACAFSPSRPR